jgi:hypothetical protein
LPLQKLGWTERGGEDCVWRNAMEFSVERSCPGARIAGRTEWSWPREGAIEVVRRGHSWRWPAIPGRRDEGGRTASKGRPWPGTLGRER